MGFFKKKPPVEVVIPFDSDWFDTWEALRIKQETNPFPVDVKVSFDGDLLREIGIQLKDTALLTEFFMMKSNSL